MNALGIYDIDSKQFYDYYLMIIHRNEWGHAMNASLRYKIVLIKISIIRYFTLRKLSSNFIVIIISVNY